MGIGVGRYLPWENGVQAMGLEFDHWEWEKMSKIKNGNGIWVSFVTAVCFLFLLGFEYCEVGFRKKKKKKKWGGKCMGLVPLPSRLSYQAPFQSFKVNRNINLLYVLSVFSPGQSIPIRTTVRPSILRCIPSFYPYNHASLITLFNYTIQPIYHS
mgnify:CR=1 FL=1